MVEWWSKHLQLLVDEGVKFSHVKDIADSGSTAIRNSSYEIFKWTHANNVPFLIFSAGCGNIVVEVLKNDNLITDNVHVLTNLIQFDENGNSVGYNEKVIHVFNKNETELKDIPYNDTITNRKNVIVMGDSVGDSTMAEGLEHSTVLKIGIHNGDDQAKLDSLKENFDIVLTGTDDVNDILELLKKIK